MTGKQGHTKKCPCVIIVSTGMGLEVLWYDSRTRNSQFLGPGCNVQYKVLKKSKAEKDSMNDDTPTDDFCAGALLSLTQRIAIPNDNSGVVVSNIPTTDDVNELESHTKSLVQDWRGFPG